MIKTSCLEIDFFMLDFGFWCHPLDIVWFDRKNKKAYLYPNEKVSKIVGENIYSIQTVLSDDNGFFIKWRNPNNKKRYISHKILYSDMDFLYDIN